MLLKINGYLWLSGYSGSLCLVAGFGICRMAAGHYEFEREVESVTTNLPAGT